MDEILKKIDEDIRVYEVLEKVHKISGNIQMEIMSKGMKHEAESLKAFILSQQKEPIGNTEQLTIGDKIRESNESLAEFIMEIQEDVKSGQVWGTTQGCIDYLNQPYTE